MKEIWKDIKCYEGMYQVSNLGRIKSLSREVNSRFGTYITDELIRKLNYKKDGYVNIDLSKNNNHKYYRVHRLVLSTFNPVDNMNNLQVNHIDGNKSNNKLTNLEWVTAKENTLHAIKIGNRGNQKGIKNPNSKLNPQKVLEILSLKDKDLSHSEIASKFNVCRKTVGNILNGKTWTHITKIKKCND